MAKVVGGDQALIANRRPAPVPSDEADWEAKIATIRGWIEEQRIVVAALRASGRSTGDADALLRDLQRCRDAMRRFSSRRAR